MDFGAAATPGGVAVAGVALASADGAPSAEGPAAETGAGAPPPQAVRARRAIVERKEWVFTMAEYARPEEGDKRGASRRGEGAGSTTGRDARILTGSDPRDGSP